MLDIMYEIPKDDNICTVTITKDYVEKIKESLRKDSSLTGVSYERIRDEFIKGIKSAKSVKYFLGLLREYGLFEWIFTGLKVGDDFIDENDPILVISVLLMGNDVGKVQKRLINLKYTVDESKDVSFLLKIRGLNIDNVIQMKKAQGNIKLSNEQILKFGKIVGMDMVLLERFVKFRFTDNTMTRYKWMLGGALSLALGLVVLTFFHSPKVTPFVS